MLQYLKTLLYIEMLLVVGIFLFRAALTPANRTLIGPKAIGLSLLTPVVALMVGNVFLFYAYLACAVAFTSRSRSELCATYLMMLPMTPALALQTTSGSTYLLPLSTIMAMNFGALLGFMITSSSRPPPRRIFDIGAFLLVALFIFIDSRDVSLTSFTRTCIVYVLQFGAPYIVMSRGVTDRTELDRALLKFVFAGVLCGVVSVFENTRHWILYQDFYSALHVVQQLGSATLNIRGGRLRTGGTIVDYTSAGLFLASILVVMPGLRSQFRRGWWLILVAMLLAALFATQSRGAWIATGLGMVAILMYRGFTARGLALLSAAAIAQFLLAELIAPTSKLAETFGTGGVSADTADYRKRLLSRGLDQVIAHPLFGQPPQQLVANMPDMVQGQRIVDFVNTHLYVAMAAGLLWFALWLLVWGAPILLAWRGRSKALLGMSTDRAEIPMAIIIVAMVGLTFTSAGERNLVWPAMALGLMGPCLALRRNAAHGRKHSRSMLASAERTEQAGLEQRSLPAAVRPSL